MDFPEKPSWDDALEIWWAVLWRFIVIMLGAGFPMTFVTGGILGLFDRLDLSAEVGRISVFLLPFPASLIAVRWAAFAIWKSRQPKEGWQPLPPSQHLPETTPGTRPPAAPSPSSGAPHL